MITLAEHLHNDSRAATARPLGVRQRRIIGALAGSAGMTAHEIASAIGYPHGTGDVEASIYGLWVRGMVVATDMTLGDGLAWGYRPRNRKWSLPAGEAAR